jgi:hypothetical protein
MNTRELTAHKTVCGFYQPNIIVHGNYGLGGSGYLYQICYGDEGLVTQARLHRNATNEALLAVVIDRLSFLQDEPFTCEEYRDAFKHANAALLCLRRRVMGHRANAASGAEEEKCPSK